MQEKIVVVGSSNTDMVLKTSRFPFPGETILGGEFFIFQGGKGANQAVAAARLGGQVHFICKVGNDSFGQSAREHYLNEGIAIEGISQSAHLPTGIAVITVNAAGENSIIVASGANAQLDVEDLVNQEQILRDSSWIITQLESPLPVVSYLASYAHQQSKRLILNPAPAQTLPPEIYKDLFLITPNESETKQLTGVEVVDEASAKVACAVLKNYGVKHVIITLGSKGAFLSCNEFEGLIPAPLVTAVDTTAAGDIFNGALVVGLSENMDWPSAVVFACRAAALSVTRMGAQTSAPTREEISDTI
ncbi:ribokinase [Arundinibacter roseus]|uniref:Ribokinase n=1 Tax=Arundinibacter roseus TaxID=2070510 RepID=A0A4R4KH82_9BACT|nr:ribokinase [Arundinibacter roseus]TDB67440.1 ribokinase [Arundinibacter roseus]